MAGRLFDGEKPVIFDHDLRLLYVNPFAAGVLRRPAGELVGPTGREAGMPSAATHHCEPLLRQVLNSGHEQTVDIASVSGERLYQVRMAPMFAPHGSVESVLCIARNVSDRPRAETAWERLYRELLEREGHLYRELMEREGRLREMVEQILSGQVAQRYKKQAATQQLLRLTRREREILRLLAKGQTYQEIGQTLGLTYGTVRNHVSRLLPKLGAVDRAQAVAFAYESGLLD
jgi:RNA polymerase sigma factor (sigma-70 family)